MKTDTQDFQKTLQDVLDKGPQTNKSLRELFGLSTKIYNAVLDEALSKLRKEGLIVYENRMWRTTSMAVCPGCAGHGLVTKRRAEEINFLLNVKE